MNRERLKAVVRGAVQGVGFRPHVYRLATSLGLDGWVSNTAQGVFVEVEGPRPQLNQFLSHLQKEKPPRAIIQGLEFSFLQAIGQKGFEIRPSDDTGPKNAFILPDISTCPECLGEMFQPGNRRYLYPFINCTHCGPRFSIIESLPYDRPHTSMKDFTMCALCEEEYFNPVDRRFHAQPNACPDCGPQLALWDQIGIILAERHDALLQAASAIRDGQIVALKGIGGFQLIADARNEDSVRRLRVRKSRDEKPFALMYPTTDRIRADCSVTEFETRLLESPEAPIVLLQRNGEGGEVAPSVAPHNPNLGAMLPSSPLHHLLMRELNFPIVATSGNLAHEPICTHELEARERLRGLADCFLVHNRPIVRAMDDSVARVVLDREMVLRRARGYAPLPVHLKHPMPAVLALGPHLKNTVALSVGSEIFVSQHIGDLETGEAWSAFRRVAADLPNLYGAAPEAIACDLHPEYLSTKHSASFGLPVIGVQHHYAHILSCMAENEVEGPVLGVSWDGTGMGLDGTLWGGEFLLVNEPPENPSSEQPFIRFAHLRNFPLPGGDAAVKQPRRAALGLLWEILGEKLFTQVETAKLRRQFSETELKMIRQMLINEVNAPLSSSAGRLFDTVAALLGLRDRSHYEGQAAMELEFAIQPGVEKSFLFGLNGKAELMVDWQPMILQILEGLGRNEPVGILAATFHNTLAEIIVAVARHAGVRQVVLSGGCFQNKYLLERTVHRLREAAFLPVWHQRIPTNDGGISLGQIVGATRVLNAKCELTEPCFA